MFGKNMIKNCLEIIQNQKKFEIRLVVYKFFYLNIIRMKS